MTIPVPADLDHIPFTAQQQERLINHVVAEIQQAENDRSGLKKRLDKEIDLYEAKPEFETKNHPWEDASNLVIPIIGSMTDTIFPRVYSTLFNVDPIFTVTARLGEWTKQSHAVQDYLDIVQQEDLKLSKVSQSLFLEGIIHGTSVLKCTWETVRSDTKVYDESGEIVKRENETQKNGPALFHVPLDDFYIPFWATSIEDSPWVAQRIRTYWGRLKSQEATGIYKDVDRLLWQFETSSTGHVQHREDLEDTRPSYQKEYEIFEWWGEFDFDEDGVDERLVVTIHMNSHTILRAQFNPYWHRRKPFREFIYWPRHDRFYGMGIATMIAPLQDEVSTLHNQGIDNRTAMNTGMWEIVTGSTADRNWKAVASGKKVYVSELGKEFQRVEIASKLDGFSDAEGVSLRYAQQRTGVSDFLQGVDSAGGAGRETATTTMVKMQEARTRFNWTLDSARDVLADVIGMTVSMLQQYGDDRDIDSKVGEEQADLVREFLALPEDEARERSKVEVTASTASMNKEAEKQNLIGLHQLTVQNALNFEAPLVQIALNPEAPEALKEYAMGKLKGQRILLERILQTFDTKNADEILGSLVALEQASQQGGPPVAPTNGTGAPGVTQPPGNANVGVPTPVL